MGALYGLQSLSDSEEVRQLLAALTPKVQQCREELDPQAVGLPLYGLQSLSDSEEVRQLLAALIEKMQQCREDLVPETVGNTLYGLKCMGDSELRHWLRIDFGMYVNQKKKKKKKKSTLRCYQC